MDWVAGITMQRMPFATCLPLSTFAAVRRSSIRPLVQEPMTTWSMGMSPNVPTTFVFSGRWGKATTGFMVERSICTSRE